MGVVESEGGVNVLGFWVFFYDGFLVFVLNDFEWWDMMCCVLLEVKKYCLFEDGLVVVLVSVVIVLVCFVVIFCVEEK